jgi:hypothetical protein
MDKDELFGGKTQKGKKERVEVRVDPSVLLEELDALERDLDQLRSTYELFFMGVERAEPRTQRDSIRSRLRRFKEIPNLNTAVKFRFGAVQARLVSLENYWGRVLRQREEGTYKRDQDKVRRREYELEEKKRREDAERARLAEEQRRLEEAERARLAAEARERSFDDPRFEDPRLRGATVARPAASSEGRAFATSELRSPSIATRSGGAAPAGAAPSATPASARPAPNVARPVASRAEDLDDGALRQLYQTYVTAKRRCGEQVDLRYEEMASSLRKQVPKLLQSTGANAVEFKVVIKSGHAVLKAVPK